MNPAQVTKFHTLKSRWVGVRRDAGRPHDDAVLDALKRRTIGRVCSSKELSQGEFDKMIAAFMAEIEPGNFGAQMAQQDQPDNRRAALLKRCDDACRAMADANAGEYQFGEAETRQRYIAGVAKKLTKKWPDACTEAELAKVAGVLEARVEQLQHAMRAHAAKVMEAARPLVSGEDF